MTNRIQALVRFLSVVVIAASWVFLVNRLPFSVDFTEDNLHSLSRETLKIVEEIKGYNTPVVINAYLSENMPASQEQTKKQLTNLLQALAREGQSHSVTVDNEGKQETQPVITVNIQRTEPYTPAEQQAKAEGVMSVKVPRQSESREVEDEVFLGLVIKARGNQEVIPFMFSSTSPEYQVMRALKAAVVPSKKVVGIVRTEIQINGGFNMDSFQNQPAWAIVEEIKKSFEVKDINPAEPITDVMDVLMVPLLSNLDQKGMDNVLAYLKKGGKALIIDDPLVIMDPNQSARAARNQGNPFNRGNRQEKPPKGNGEGFYADLGVEFAPKLNNSGQEEWGKRIVWYDILRYPRLRNNNNNVKDIAVVTSDENAISSETPITEGIREILLLMSGDWKPIEGTEMKFTKLITVPKKGGELSHDDYIRRGGSEFDQLFGSKYQPNAHPMAYKATPETEYTLAALIEGKVHKEGSSDKPAEGEEAGKEGDKQDSDTTKIVLVGDMDSVSDQIYTITTRPGPDGKPAYRFDNIDFVLNALEYLSGEPVMGSLRGKSDNYRALTKMEEILKESSDSLLKKEEELKTTLEAKVTEARADFDKRVRALEEECQSSKDMIDCRQRLETTKQTLQKAFDANVAELSEKNELEKRLVEGEKREKSTNLKLNVRLVALFLAPIPVIILGILIILMLRGLEMRSVPTTRVRETRS